MTFTLALLCYGFALFAVIYLFRRNVGMPALGLTAGAVLASVWTAPLAAYLATQGINPTSVPLTSLVTIGLTLLPALIVMSRSTGAHGLLHRAYSGVVFALLGVVLTLPAFRAAVAVDANSQQLMTQVMTYQPLIITACIALALVDILYHRKHKEHGAHRKKEH